MAVYPQQPNGSEPINCALTINRQGKQTKNAKSIYEVENCDKPHRKTEGLKSTHEYESSRKVTKHLVDHVIKQEPKIKLQDESTKEVKIVIKKIRNDLYQQHLNEIKETLDESQKRQNEIIREPGCTAWLVTFPIGDYNYSFTKQEFSDAIRLRYNWPIPNLPSLCVCGEKYDVQHFMSCKNGGFITHRHNKLRDIAAKLLE